jgi:hypothetical protein
MARKMQDAKMKHIVFSILLLMLSFSVAFAQLRDYRFHLRGMLHETVYNTGEIGRGYDGGTAGIVQGFPSMEWPPNSYEIIDRIVYSGQHNSFGGGVWIAGTRDTIRLFEYCGAVSDNGGNATPVENTYSIPISINRAENYPVLATGNLNPAYNPDEAEEIITAKWKTPDALGITVTRTSRAWSFPGYDCFIIYEYEMENTTSDTIADIIVAFPYVFGTSMFGYQRANNRWSEADLRQTNQFARFDFRRFMTYNHDRIGKPDSAFFDIWSRPGDRGGLNSPQAAGLVTLHYDYDHLATKGHTQLVVTGSDTVSWDANHKIKQPFLNRYENGNLYPSKMQTWLDPSLPRKTRPYRLTAADTGFFNYMKKDKSQRNDPYYWLGRVRPSVELGWWQPASHGYGFGPYNLPPHDKMRFAFAEVVGYGPGVAGDSVYMDIGGGIRGEPDPMMHPVPSWYKTLTYANVGTPPVIGSDYLQTHPLPWYILNPNVVSIRDVADRAIQMYTGGGLVKYDTVQFKPDLTSAFGAYNTVSVPVPSPVMRVENSRTVVNNVTRPAVNKIIWGPQVESFSNVQTHGRLHAPFKYYKVVRSIDPLGPWTLIDSVGKRDPRYFQDSVYVVYDTASHIGEYLNYAVVSVDSLGGLGGWTNMTAHQTQAGPVATLGKVYVVPNPLIVTNGLSGSDPNGEVTDRLQFFGLTKHCTIRVFSYSGQLITTIQHDVDAYNSPWYQITRNNQLLASGVYFFVVEDKENGARSHGKFVIIH